MYLNRPAKSSRSLLRRIFGIRLAYLIVSLLILLPASAVALSANSNHLKNLRLEIEELDKAGKDAEVNTKIVELNRFVSTHTNTSLRSSQNDTAPIQLVGRYERAVKALSEKAAQSQGNNNLYLDAQKSCTSAGNIPYTVLALCISQYVADRTGGGQVQTISPPPKELFIYDFSSPLVAFDLAGVLCILTLITAFLVVIRLLAVPVRKYLRK